MFRTWLATAATPLSTSPASTSSARSERRCLMLASSACGRPRPARLPPRAAACLRASALAGSCHQQKVLGGSTLTVHGELSRFVPRHRFISLGPSPPFEGARWELANRREPLPSLALPAPSVVIIGRPPTLRGAFSEQTRP